MAKKIKTLTEDRVSELIAAASCAEEVKRLTKSNSDCWAEVSSVRALISYPSWQRLMLRNLLTALLGAVLALLALWLINPRALQRTADNGWLTLPPCKVNHGQDYQWDEKKKEYKCVDVPTKAEVTVESPTTTAAPIGAASTPDPNYVPLASPEFTGRTPPLPKHELRFMVKEGTLKCWVRITADGQAPTEGFYSHPPTNGNTSVLMWVGSQVQAPSAEIRSGCPGRVEYYVDGNQRFPENRSGTPDKSEVVTLP